ncbi:hypothetical protein CEXT_706441, partial [Caerostris extrusa]
SNSRAGNGTEKKEPRSGRSESNKRNPALSALALKNVAPRNMMECYRRQIRPERRSGILKQCLEPPKEKKKIRRWSCKEKKRKIYG